jgi:hypothetical protein
MNAYKRRSTNNLLIRVHRRSSAANIFLFVTPESAPHD